MVKFEKVDDWYEERKRKCKIAALIILIVGIIAGGGYGFYYLRKESLHVEQSNEERKIVKKEEQAIPSVDEPLVMIDIKGEVATPGTYRLKPSARIQDAIQEAGGLTKNADTSLLNLSKKVRDEMVIVVYSKDQVQNIKKTVQEEEQAIIKCPVFDESIVNDACICQEEKEPNTSPKKETETKKVSLNSATLEQLMTLSGIGEAKAKLIIAYRDAHQGFRSIEELKEIQGIGESIFAKISENITL